MLNRALRFMNADLIINLDFFVSDLHHHQMEQFSSQKLKKAFAVYRGQGMTKEQFDRITSNKGGLLFFNCFLSTSKNRQVSLKFAQRATMNPELTAAMFIGR